MTILHHAFMMITHKDRQIRYFVCLRNLNKEPCKKVLE